MSDDILDYLVIGAGPAGLQMGHFLHRAGRDYRILEAASGPGAFFRTFPRHRTLISINKKHTGWDDPELNLRMDWNSLLSDDPDLLFTRYSDRYFPGADDLVRYLEDFAAAQGLHVTYDARVAEVARPDPGEPFRVTDEQGRTYRARHVIVATGFTRPNVPPIPGIETAELYGTHSTDPADYTDMRVLIIGKGNSAFETADNLIETAAVVHVAGPRSVRMAWRTHFVGHLRAVNNNFLDTYQLKSQNAVLDGDIRRIERRADGSYLVTVAFVRADEVTKDIPYDRVIVCTGFRFDASIFAPECRPELTINDRFPALTPAFESVNVPDLHFAGTITQSRDFKRGTSGFIHGFRYGVRALHRILEARHHGVPWPGRELPADPDALAAAVLERVNRSSALWQQFGVLADVIVPDGRGGARYLEELPVDLQGPPIGDDGHFTITLEYGPDHDAVDPFDVSVGRITQSDARRAHEGHYLHPVVRRYRGGVVEAVHHVTENLENDWTSEEVHHKPLREFFQHQSLPVSV
ncbi:pyridine nucleotide-disulfide oxidoreductase [Microbispora rosea subsp. aerata]|nr:NAD(P)-binding domain-containing protein [Microbispora rosea]GGO13416.1 pyridine nucleotide-disulfide oxidoreductase [Microbispora rosea subsp. aerata]GIH54023.1 pyridine nucleotide-disulfide oxidoreductase [Microbispora rosea subsp. aerata]GLJ84996.1 pyridine nucleotide-disulfide oxidoreductase [Microbispora rosea subsp. aerata]